MQSPQTNRNRALSGLLYKLLCQRYMTTEKLQTLFTTSGSVPESEVWSVDDM